MPTCKECGAYVKPKAMEQHEQYHNKLREALDNPMIQVSPLPHDPPKVEGTEITKAL